MNGSHTDSSASEDPGRNLIPREERVGMRQCLSVSHHHPSPQRRRTWPPHVPGSHGVQWAARRSASVTSGTERAMAG